MSTITTASFQKGLFIEFKGEPHQIMEFQHVNPGKGSAFVRTKLKGLKTGKSQEFTFKSGESVTEIPVETREMQYLYKEGDAYIFMDNSSFEQYRLSESLLGNYVHYLKPNDTYMILINGEEPVGLHFPKKVRLLVTEADEGARGNTVSGSATKTVVVETGAVVTVPLFIKLGDVIAIDPETGDYLERG
ncbi:elongation factor P [Candidatus Gottesmanbacteria bacterium RBG_13_45_10]|uniref:Elongation factor P n=1 Tax=Candidatus Gottesmanbacteria bacterium RBG_13_45_10 TaxID=1798370 RepID=A0A1F5ZHL9_9BACT|nr:MAG: elongation factor P [Candidatus Gottesmanbacteria bacterium RBG_13_45_10]